jgi:hypothetical protein
VSAREASWDPIDQQSAGYWRDVRTMDRFDEPPDGNDLHERPSEFDVQSPSINSADK